MREPQQRKWVAEYLKLYPGNISHSFVERLNSMSDRALRKEIAKQRDEWQRQNENRARHGNGPFADAVEEDKAKRATAALIFIEILARLAGPEKKEEARASPTREMEPPTVGQFLVCLFVSPERQIEKLGDMEEQFNTIWLPKFGPKRARGLYLCHAVGCAAHLAKNAVIIWIVGHVMKVIQNFR